MHDSDDPFFLERAYFYGVDGDALRLEQILHGARCGFQESAYRLIFLRATVDARLAAFVAAGGAASAGTDRLLEAIDAGLAALPDNERRLNWAGYLCEQARHDLASAALHTWPDRRAT